jgi:hypothetical protein
MKQSAKEKAVELIDYYRTYIRKADGYNYLLPQDEVYLAKQCALKVVNEVLGYMGADRGYEFWQEVRKEIENYA